MTKIQMKKMGYVDFNYLKFIQFKIRKYMVALLFSYMNPILKKWNKNTLKSKGI